MFRGRCSRPQAIIKDNKVAHIHKLNSYTRGTSGGGCGCGCGWVWDWVLRNGGRPPLNTVLTHVNSPREPLFSTQPAVLDSIGEGSLGRDRISQADALGGTLPLPLN